MATNSQKIENAVLVNLAAEVPSEEELLQLVEALRTVYPVSDEEKEAIIRRLHARLPIHMDVGTKLVASDHEPWLNARKPSIAPFYWDRFAKYLFTRQWVPKVVNALDEITDEILDSLGDPEGLGSWGRRGLVMGDVQSGKTATYTALSCKAADAGYRLIVLLTGTLESLRRQTQERLDEGFVGLDSAPFLSMERQTKHVGVGFIDQSRTGAAFTSRTADFSTRLMTQLNFRLVSFKEPILFVVKKNKRILQNLEDWLRNYNAGPDGKISVPMLLIDDEADNASVNVAALGEDPRAINTRIRALLSLFQRSTYVGFTATPFANIFIDPDTPHDMLGDDLFPRDFFYALEAPTNYLGADKVFNSNEFPGAICDIADASVVFPYGHKSSLRVEHVPESLEEATRCFVLTNAVRDLRGHAGTHRSMLVNVSRFTNVQDQVAEVLNLNLRLLQSDIRNYSMLSKNEALDNPSLRSLKAAWEEHFVHCNISWSNVQAALIDAALPIVVRAVNQRTGAASLDYSEYRKTGLRVIAVGGNSLSRGLTLEGLCESYFYRNSQMYDTLLQMGRWFGYRDEYGDLCRIWLTPEAQHWYGHIASATVELREEVRRMGRSKMTPKDFGLKVRAHPDGLIVTARNKMRTAKTIEKVVSVSNQYLETPRLWRRGDIAQANMTVLNAYLARIAGRRVRSDNDGKTSTKQLWSSVPKFEIAGFLREFQIHPYNLTFQGQDLARFLDATEEPMLANWDVAIPGGTGKRFQIGPDIEIRLRERSVLLGMAGDLVVSGKSARVASRGDEAIGLDLAVRDAVERDYLARVGAKANVPDHAYRGERPRPLLLIHMVQAKPRDIDRREIKIDLPLVPLIALGISFPKFDDSAVTRRVTYKVNLVEWRALFEAEQDDDIEECNE